MINVSNDFKKRMEESRNFKDYAQVTFADGSEMTLDSDQFVPTNSALSDGDDDGFPIGVAVQKNVQLEIINDDQQYATKDFLGAKIRLYTDFQLDEVDPWVGRNLLEKSKCVGKNYYSEMPNTDSKWGVVLPTTVSQPAFQSANLWENNKFALGDKYTISFMAEADGDTLLNFDFFPDNFGGVFGNPKKSVSTIPKRYSLSGELVWVESAIPTTMSLRFWRMARDSNYEIRVWDIKVENGDVATDYTIAPEDIRTERIEKGTYTVITPETYGETVIITAYDDMYKADKDYTTALTFPQTAGAVLRDICDTCGISLGSTSFLHDDFQIQTKPTGKFREVIGQIAMIACGNARIDRQNRLQIMPYNLEWEYNANVVAGENLLTNTKSVLEYNASKQNWNFGYQNNVSVNETDKETDSRHFVTIGNGNSNNGIGSTITGIQFKKGEVYTFSCDIKGTYNDSYEFGGQIFFTDTNGSAWANVGKTSWKEFVTENEFSRCSFTFTIPDSYDESVNRLVINIRCQEMDIYVKRFKLEKGSTATPWTPAPSDNLTPYILLDEFTAPKIEYNDTVITGFKTVIKGETSEEDTEILQGTDTYCITVENPLISGHEETVLSWLLERVGNVPFRPFSGDAISNPLVEFMDLAKVQDRRGNQYNTFITDVNFLMPGYTTLKNSTPSATRSAIAYTSNSARVEQRARQLVEIEKNARELAVERLQEALAQGSGLYPTEERQPDGSTIYYLHDKPTKAESKVVIKLTSEGIGISQNGGSDYPWGITFTGEAILKLIYAVGIDCDYLTTGAITVKDNSGNIIFQVDMDTKSVTISGDHVRIGGKSATTALSDNLKESKDYTDGKLVDYAKTVTSSIDNLQAQIDGAIESHYYNYAPSLENIPASEWKTDEERLKHEGDLFYDKSTGYAYRFFKDEDGTWKWQPIQDTDIVKALATAKNAKDTADGKRRNFVVKPTPPYDEGDQWTDGDDIKTCVTAKSKGEAFAESDWQKLNKYTDDTVANQALDEARKSTNLTIILDNEYQGIPTDSTGKYSGTLSVSTIVQTYYGHQNVSSTCTYTFQKSDGVTYTWDGATRKCTITALTTDTGWVDITASYMSLFTVTKRFNVAKVRAGAVGATGDSYVPNIAQKTNQGVTGWVWNLNKGDFTTAEVVEDGIRCCKLTLNAIPSGSWSVIEYTQIGRSYFQAGKKYTVSFEVKGSVSTGIAASFREKGGINQMEASVVTKKNTVTANTWTKCVYVFTMKNPLPTSTTQLLYLTGMTSTAGVSYTFRNVMISEGEITNPVWTPAPQDLVGPQGPQGATGAQGPKGDKGATGDKGAKGDKGDTGTAGRMYFIEPSTLVVKRSANNTMAPNYIVFSAYYRDGANTARTAYSGRFKIEESLDGDKWTAVYTSAANESSITHSLYGALATSAGGAISSASNKTIGVPRDVVAIRCTLYAAGGTTQVLDMQTAAVVIDVAALTHEEIFNLLTNNGAMKGIYQEGNQLYISFTYAKGGILTLGGTNDGNGQINVLDGNGNVVGWWNKDGLFINNKIQTSGPSVLSETMYMILTQGALNGWANNHVQSFRLSCRQISNNVDLKGAGILIKDFYELGFLANNGICYRLSSDNCIQTAQNTDVKRIHTFWGDTRHHGSSYLSNVYLGSDDGNDIKLNRVNYGGAALAVQGGMYAYGDIGCSGKKNRVIDTEDYATRLQYSYEMSAPLFGDIGQAQTDENGECYIYLNDIFAETVSTQIEYQVFLQKEGKGDVWVEEKTWQYFVVKGTENLKFAWEIKAKQKQYEYDYLEKCEISEESEATINYEEEYIREINILIMKREEQLYETA